MPQQETFRPPVAAGRFYPADPTVLSSRLHEYLAGNTSLADPGPLGLICPHAGYDYSGAVAGRAYRELAGRPPEAVVVLGPSHYDRFRGATIWPGAGYRTPLGDVPHPQALVEALEASGTEIHLNRLGHREEHSVEVQIPFLQEIAPQVPVLAMVLADDRAETCKSIGEALARAVSGRRIILVASSDFYHGHSNRECRESDARTVAALERNEPREIAGGFESGALRACGRGPIMAVLCACRQLGACRVEVLARTNSDEVTGQAGGYVVGYVAAAIHGT